MEAGSSNGGDSKMAVGSGETFVSGSGTDKKPVVTGDTLANNAGTAGSHEDEDGVVRDDNVRGISSHNNENGHAPYADDSDSESEYDSDSDADEGPSQPLTKNARKRQGSSGAFLTSKPAPSKKPKLDPKPKPDLTFEQKAEAFAEREIKNVNSAAKKKTDRFKRFKELAREADLESKQKLGAKDAALEAKDRLLEVAKNDSMHLRVEVNSIYKKNSGLQDKVSRLEEEKREHICGSEWRDKYHKLADKYNKMKTMANAMSGLDD